MKKLPKSPFEKRHFFYCDTRVDPGDPAAMKRMIDWRAKLLAPLAKMDGVAIIDSDPGGYPDSTNEQFVNLLLAHREMLNDLRPGIELYYWMHAGWLGYGRFYKIGVLSFSTDDEQTDMLSRLKNRNPEPWGVANGLAYARKLEIDDRVINFNYGRIEGEPSFPMTNFGGTSAFDGGAASAPRGAMGNAQTHCVQLPNTFAFATRGNRKTSYESRLRWICRGPDSGAWRNDRARMECIGRQRPSARCACAQPSLQWFPTIVWYTQDR